MTRRFLRVIQPPFISMRAEAVQNLLQVALVDHRSLINLIDFAAKFCGEAQVSLELFKEGHPLFGSS